MSILTLVIAGSAVFLALLVWKARWLWRKMNEAPPPETDPDRGDPSKP